MLDTSDRNVFNSGYDPSMGTTGFQINITDIATVVLPFDNERRQFVLTNAGYSTIYVNFAIPATPTNYTVRLQHNGLVSVDKFGGAVTAICDTGNSSYVYVTVMH